RLLLDRGGSWRAGASKSRTRIGALSRHVRSSPFRTPHSPHSAFRTPHSALRIRSEPPDVGSYQRGLLETRPSGGQRGIAPDPTPLPFLDPVSGGEETWFPAVIAFVPADRIEQEPAVAGPLILEGLAANNVMGELVQVLRDQGSEV